MSLAQEIIALEHNRQNIVNAVNAKGGNLAENAPLNAIAPAIEVLPSGGKEIEIGLITGKGLTEYIIPDGVTYLKSYAFAYDEFESITIPTTLKSLNIYSFSHCSNLKIINGAENLSIINAYVFQNCTSLEIVVFINTTSVGSYAFRNDTALKYVEIGNISSVSTYTFYGCTSLEVVDLSRCTTVPTLSNVNAFTDVPITCTIKVPAALYNDWITKTNWSTLYIQGYNFVAI